MTNCEVRCGITRIRSAIIDGGWLQVLDFTCGNVWGWLKIRGQSISIPERNCLWPSYSVQNGIYGVVIPGAVALIHSWMAWLRLIRVMKWVLEDIKRQSVNFQRGALMHHPSAWTSRRETCLPGLVRVVTLVELRSYSRQAQGSPWDSRSLLTCEILSFDFSSKI